MKNLKESFLFSLVFYGFNVFLNAIAWIVIESTSTLFQEYPFYESQGGVFLFFVPLIFLFTWIFKVNRVWIYFPIVYFALGVYVMFPNSLEGWDAMCFLNFEFSKWVYITYEIIQKSSLLENSIFKLLVFNGVMFIYQMGLLYYSNKLLSRIKEKISPATSKP